MSDNTAKDWWGTFLQNQLMTVITFIFFGGVLYSKLGTLEDDVKTMKGNLNQINEIDTRARINDIRLNSLEEWRRDSEIRENRREDDK